ncbi:3-keto-5-aminohexanoate cleavage protein [Gemmobacter sp.]|uniref:3-keto-5-aminohexanoate cleavage protein n=1 Tax=Gemmobacter sp. TaxID=1898957 RepID=UPI002AFF960B|nr:3-keto-5-aminohexanoate cleavage protein [Gemmobacter sp.]
MSKVLVTCSLNGVLTDPRQHNVPVTPAEMAAEARRAWDAGASIMHIHLRDQSAQGGNLPSWDIGLSREVQAAIRDACPGVIINHTTGVVGPGYSQALDIVRATAPEMAACNAGTLNYLKTRKDGSWAWPPMVFDNPVEKVQEFIDAITSVGAIPEFECFDTGIVRSVGMFRQAGMFTGAPQMNFVMGVASGMPCRADLLPILCDLAPDDARWQVTAIGRAEIWATHRACAELGGHLRTGLEDTFYLASGEKVTSNGQLIDEIVGIARDAGREPATAAEARAILGLPATRA